jgi:hypothetical protein
MGLFDRFLKPQPPRTKERGVLFTLCAERFIERDWKGALEHAAELAKGHRSLQVLQIILISVQRIPNGRQSAEYKALYDDAVASVRETRGFDTVALRLTLGEISLSDALAAASSDRERCKAYYYAGAQMLNRGNANDAASALLAAATIQDGGWEKRFAQAEAVRASELAAESTIAADKTAAGSASELLRAAAARAKAQKKDG